MRFSLEDNALEGNYTLANYALGGNYTLGDSALHTWRLHIFTRRLHNTYYAITH